MLDVPGIRVALVAVSLALILAAFICWRMEIKRPH